MFETTFRLNAISQPSVSALREITKGVRTIPAADNPSVYCGYVNMVDSKEDLANSKAE